MAKRWRVGAWVLGGLLVPSVARAEERPELERGGFVLSLRMSPGVAFGRDTSAVVTRFGYTLGAMVGKRVVLGADVGTTLYWGQKKPSFHGDVMGELFAIKGLFLRVGAGVESRVPTPRDVRPGIGGSLGLGYEFPIARHGALRLLAEYDVRVRPDRQLGRMALFGLEFRGYLKK